MKENENKGNCTVGLYVGLRSWRVKVQRFPYISLMFNILHFHISKIVPNFSVRKKNQFNMVNILFFIKRKKLLKDETAPIYIRVTVNKVSLWVAILMFLFGSEKEDKWTFINPFLTHELTGESAFWWKVGVKPTD